MRIITNPGSNLTPEIVSHYGIDLAPQKIVVDGVLHDTRDGIPLTTVDEWVQNAKEHPHVLGTAAAEFATILRDLGDRDDELLVVMTSKKIIQSYVAAISAAKTLADHPRYQRTRIRVVDTKVTDMGAGLMTLLAAELRAAGRSLDEIADTLDALAERVRMCLYVATLDNLVRGGRASFLRAWLANVFQVRPLITFREGELKAAGKVKVSANPAEAMVRFLVDEIGQGERVWVGIGHGGARTLADRVLDKLREAFVVDYARITLISSSIYLHTGPGSVGVFVLPVGSLDPPPSVPPAFA
jgi:DegV family protein with EDD domain